MTTRELIALLSKCPAEHMDGVVQISVQTNAIGDGDLCDITYLSWDGLENGNGGHSNDFAGVLIEVKRQLDTWPIEDDLDYDDDLDDDEEDYPDEDSPDGEMCWCGCDLESGSHTSECDRGG